MLPLPETHPRVSVRIFKDVTAWGDESDGETVWE